MLLTAERYLDWKRPDHAEQTPLALDNSVAVL
jgi:hypothetical protein